MRAGVPRAVMLRALGLYYILCGADLAMAFAEDLRFLQRTEAGVSVVAGRAKRPSAAQALSSLMPAPSAIAIQDSLISNARLNGDPVRDERCHKKI